MKQMEYTIKVLCSEPIDASALVDLISTHATVGNRVLVVELTNYRVLPAKKAGAK